MKFDSQFYEDQKNYELMINREYERTFKKKYEIYTKKSCIKENYIYNICDLSECIENRFKLLNLDDKVEDIFEMKVKALDYLKKDIPLEYKYFWLNECPKDKIDWQLFQWEDELKKLHDFESVYFKKFNENIKINGLTKLSDICKNAIERSLFVKCEYRKFNDSDFYEDLKISDKAIRAFKEAIYYQPKVKPLRNFKNFDKKIFMHISKAISSIPNINKEQAVNTAVEIMWGISSGTLKDRISNDDIKAIDMGVYLVKQGRWSRPSGMPCNG